MRVIEQTLFLSFSRHCHCRYASTFLRYSNQRQNAAATSSAVIVLLTPPQVFLRLSWVIERPASCCFTFVNKKKSTGAKSGEKSGSALAVNQFLAAAEFMTQELFQPEISVKNGLDGKIRLTRAEARSLVAKRSIS